MFYRTSFLTLLAVAMTFVVTSDAFAFHRGRRSSSRPIFSSGRTYLFASSAPQPAAVCCAPAATCCVPTATVATRSNTACSPARTVASSFAKP